MSGRSMRNSRPVALGLLFLALLGLEIGHGVFRMRSLREAAEEKLLVGVERAHKELADFILRSLEEEREHAGYLARMPSLRALLEDRENEATWRSLEGHLTPYVLSFRGIDRVRVLDLEGRELFRCERIGMGVGSIPRMLLSREMDRDIVALALAAPPGGVATSGLSYDATRVEVPESHRQVLHFAVPVRAGDRPFGILALTVYAFPLLERVRTFAPAEGVLSHLDDGAGRPLRSAAPEPEPATSAGVGTEAGGPVTAVFRAPISSGAPPWLLVTEVPQATLEAASRSLRQEYLWVVITMGLTSLLILLAGVVLVRLSLREIRHEEAERYRRKQADMERRMQLSEKLGSLGLLTAGVAHEINNPLEGIENYLALLERPDRAPEERRRYLEMVRHGFHRIRDIVRDLAAFSRPSVSQADLDITQVLRQALKLVGYSRDFKAIEVRLEGLEEPLRLPGDPGRLEQVFVNLFLNAGKAMKGAGVLTVSARVRQEEAMAEIAVEDTGCGVAPENLARIFDPFFTTLGGTGLGLSVSYGIVQAHGGTIQAENRAESGARFTVLLPLAARPGGGAAETATPAALAGKAQPRPVDLSRGGE